MEQDYTNYLHHQQRNKMSVIKTVSDHKMVMKKKEGQKNMTNKESRRQIDILSSKVKKSEDLIQVL